MNRSCVRPARVDEIASLTEILAQAFAADPVYAWLFPAQKTRGKRLRQLFALFISHFISCDGVWVLSGVPAIAVWQRPAAPSFPPGVQVQIARLLQGQLWRGLLWQLLVESRVPSMPHGHLMLLGVHPSTQGKGAGTVLLQHIVQHCERRGWPLYLDTGQVANLPFYQRQGFSLIRSVRLPAGPRVFQFLRLPGK